MAEVSKMKNTTGDISQTGAPQLGNFGDKLKPKRSKTDEFQAQMDAAMQREGTRTVKNPEFQGGWLGGGTDAQGNKRFITEKYTYTDPQMEKMKRESQFGGAARGIDMERGRDAGREIFENQLGRVEEPRSEAMAALLGQRKQQMEQGLGNQAFQAAREQRLRGLQGQNQMQNRNLASMQARSGIRGGAAAGQMAQLMGQQQQSRQGAEQDLLLADAQLKQGMMDKYGQQLSGIEAQELANKKFNLGQIGKEKFGELSTGLSEQQMGVAERTGVRQADSAALMARAMAASGGGGGKK